MNILHLTHTDILHDSRILKEMQCIARSYGNHNIVGIGIATNRGGGMPRNTDAINIHSLVLKTSRWLLLPIVVRHACSLIEFNTKIFFKSLAVKPKVIHCHDTLVLPLGVLLKIMFRAKLVYDAHELESDRSGITKSLSKLTLFVENFFMEVC